MAVVRAERSRVAILCGVLASAVGGAGAPAAQAQGLKAAVFDIEPVEMPKTPEMRDRLTRYTAMLRQELAARGVTIVDLAPQAAKIADNLPLSQCNGCDQDIAKALGADLEVTTAVQPASSNVFNFSGSVKDVATNRVLRQGTVNIAGTGDDYWSHGVKFLVRERLEDPALPTDAAALRKAVAALPRTE